MGPLQFHFSTANFLHKPTPPVHSTFTSSKKLINIFIAAKWRPSTCKNITSLSRCARQPFECSTIEQDHAQSDCRISRSAGRKELQPSYPCSSMYLPTLNLIYSHVLVIDGFTSFSWLCTLTFTCQGGGGGGRKGVFLEVGCCGLVN